MPFSPPRVYFWNCLIVWWPSDTSTALPLCPVVPSRSSIPCLLPRGGPFLHYSPRTVRVPPHRSTQRVRNTGPPMRQERMAQPAASTHRRTAASAAACPSTYPRSPQMSTARPHVSSLALTWPLSSFPPLLIHLHRLDLLEHLVILLLYKHTTLATGRGGMAEGGGMGGESPGHWDAGRFGSREGLPWRLRLCWP